MTSLHFKYSDVFNKSKFAEVCLCVNTPLSKTNNGVSKQVLLNSFGPFFMSPDSQKLVKFSVRHSGTLDTLKLYSFRFQSLLVWWLLHCQINSYCFDKEVSNWLFPITSSFPTTAGQSSEVVCSAVTCSSSSYSSLWLLLLLPLLLQYVKLIHVKQIQEMTVVLFCMRTFEEHAK